MVTPAARGHAVLPAGGRIRRFDPVVTLAVVAALVPGCWLLLILTVPAVRFVIVAPAAKTGTEIILSLGSLFGALVLLLFPAEGERLRLRWIATGLLLLGVSALMFGYVRPLITDADDINRARCTALLTQTLATGLFAIGILPTTPWSLPTPRLLTIVTAACAAALAVYLLADSLVELTTLDAIEEATRGNRSVMPGLTIWHWVLSTVPLSLSIGVAVVSVTRSRREQLWPWLVLAMVLIAGAQLHGIFWPSGYLSTVTTSTVFRLAFTLLILGGAIRELTRIAAERDARLAAEQAYSEQLNRLTALRADFTAMVAHELASPISGIRRSADVARVGELQPHQRQALHSIEQEVQLLLTLVGDIQASAAIERDEFAVRPEPIALDVLLADAEAFARGLPGNHPIHVSGIEPALVLADPERIVQVLRNLLENAAKFSAEGTLIELVVTRDGNTIHLQVRDRGHGIHPNDVRRVFEKFGRGRDLTGQRVPGVGLGLYLSRRIVEAHGSDLRVESVIDEGSTFSFSLRLA